jgi:hypothetical protein
LEVVVGGSCSYSASEQVVSSEHTLFEVAVGARDWNWSPVQARNPWHWVSLVAVAGRTRNWLSVHVDTASHWRSEVMVGAVISKLSPTTQ